MVSYLYSQRIENLLSYVYVKQNSLKNWILAKLLFLFTLSCMHLFLNPIVLHTFPTIGLHHASPFKNLYQLVIRSQQHITIANEKQTQNLPWCSDEGLA